MMKKKYAEGGKKPTKAKNPTSSYSKSKLATTMIGGLDLSSTIEKNMKEFKRQGDLKKLVPVKKDKWGRPEGSKWYGYDPAKTMVKSATKSGAASAIAMKTPSVKAKASGSKSPVKSVPAKPVVKKVVRPVVTATKKKASPAVKKELAQRAEPIVTMAPKKATEVTTPEIKREIRTAAVEAPKVAEKKETLKDKVSNAKEKVKEAVKKRREARIAKLQDKVKMKKGGKKC